jgi:hypothetical protein
MPIVINCPTCRRVIWEGAACANCHPPYDSTPIETAPKEPGVKEPPEYKGRNRDRGRPDGKDGTKPKKRED